MTPGPLDHESSGTGSDGRSNSTANEHSPAYEAL
jgi:hypothetical protein